MKMEPADLVETFSYLVRELKLAHPKVCFCLFLRVGTKLRG